MNETNCDICGHFVGSGSSWAYMFSFGPLPEPSHTPVRCKRCTEEVGPIQSNARPNNGDLAPYQGIRP